MIEIQGPSGSGKTSLAMFILMTTILPRTHHGHEGDRWDGGRDVVEMGGKEQMGVWVHMSDHSSRAPMTMLSKAMQSHIETCLSRAEIYQPRKRAAIIKTTLESAFSRLLVLPVEYLSSDDLGLDGDGPLLSSPFAPLCSSLQMLYLHGKRQIDGEVALVVIDGIGDTYWESRWYRDQSKHQHSKTPNHLTGAGEVGIHTVLEHLTRLRREWGSVVVVTNQALWKPVHPESGRSDPSSLFWAQHLPHPWPSPFQPRPMNPSSEPYLKQPKSVYWPLTIHITLRSPALEVGQFRPDVTLQETWRQGGEGFKREMARRERTWKGYVRVHVNGTAAGGHRAEGGYEGYGKFEFKIEKDGVVVENPPE